jgi:glycine/D-amino acid oxidase-like deaminating enzyme
VNASEQIVVVGGGVLGLLTAVACAAAGSAVTVLERGPLPNPEASSHDQQRIVRALHHDDPEATRRGVLARRAWGELETLLGERLYHPTGVLSVLRPAQVPFARTALADAGGRGELLDPAEPARRWPHLRFPAGAAGLLEPEAGVVLAERALAALTNWLRAQPRVTLRPHHEVTAVDPAAGTVSLADGATLRGRIVLTAGAWSRPLLPAAVAGELRLRRQTMLYCDVPAERRAAWASTPVVLSLDPEAGTWLVPPVAGTQLKLSASTACRAVPELADHAAPARWRAHLSELFAGQIAGFGPDWVAAARDCYYLEDAASGGAREVALGQGPATVWSHAACGGGAFKFAPLIARSLAARVAPGAPAAPPAFAAAGSAKELDD